MSDHALAESSRDGPSIEHQSDGRPYHPDSHHPEDDQEEGVARVDEQAHPHRAEHHSRTDERRIQPLHALPDDLHDEDTERESGGPRHSRHHVAIMASREEQLQGEVRRDDKGETRRRQVECRVVEAA